MIEESTLKSNFIGRDGFRWWIGQIAPVAAAPAQAEGKGWGIRYKVRIMGYHPYNTQELPNEDLPWAGVLLPITAGSGGGSFAQSSRIRQGDVVVGFFLDGDDAQIPMIMGSFGKTQFVPSNTPYENPFAPFTGYTDNIKPAENKSDRESTGQSTEDQKQPRNVDGQTVSALNAQNEDSESGKAKEHKASIATGQTITFADVCEDNFATEVTGILGNLIKVIGEATDFLGDVQSAIKQIQVIANQFVGTLFKSLFNELIPLLKQGLDALYSAVFAKTFTATLNPIAAGLAGIAAQKAMVGPVGALQEAITCVAGKIINGLGDTIKDLIESTLLEVVNFGICSAEQFVGGFLNDVIDQIDSGLESALGAVDKILGPAFKIQEFLRGSVDVIKSIQDFFDCNQSGKEKCKGVKEWTIGYGPKQKADVDKMMGNILENANVSKALSGISTGTSPYTKPGCGTPSSCGGPQVSFFGGDGIGGAAKVIMGGIVNNTDGLGEISADVAKTGSIIGVEITDPGSGYKYAPPVVSFDDPCGLGYGAVGRAIVDFDQDSPTFGQIKGVYILSEGENYPVEDDTEGAVVDGTILYPGSGYSPGDIAVDDNGVEYELKINDGKIIEARPTNNIRVQNLPNINIITKTGSGALIKPLINPFISEQREVVDVIDCIDTQLVGYVNGAPYYGPFHKHVRADGTVVKMVGRNHVSTPHSVIYETREESLKNSKIVSSTSQMRSITNQVTSDQSTSTETSEQTSTTNTTSTSTSPTSSTPPSSPPPSTPPSSPPPSTPPSGGGYGGY